MRGNWYEQECIIQKGYIYKLPITQLGYLNKSFRRKFVKMYRFSSCKRGTEHCINENSDFEEDMSILVPIHKSISTPLIPNNQLQIPNNQLQIPNNQLQIPNNQLQIHNSISTPLIPNNQLQIPNNQLQIHNSISTPLIPNNQLQLDEVSCYASDTSNTSDSSHTTDTSFKSINSNGEKRENSDESDKSESSSESELNKNYNVPDTVKAREEISSLDEFFQEDCFPERKKTKY